jgi:AraC-like DNA-binding protein/mannose-6-phosphate isomerase-like protein (cupin superfamily)
MIRVIKNISGAAAMNDFYISFKIDNVTFGVTKISNQIITTTYPKHCHSKNSYEIHYIPFGYGTVIINNTSYEVSPNTLYITGPNVMHEQIPDSQNPMSEYGVYFDVTFKRENVKKKSAVNTFLSNDFWFGQDNQNMILIFKQLFDELTNRFIGYTHNLESLCKMLIISITRNYENTSRSFPLLPEFSQDTARNLTVEDAFLYEYKTLTMDALSKKIGLSKRQTERLLKEQYGKTFLQKRTEARMSAALILLKSDKTVSQVAEIVGYSSSEHFTNAFKQFYGKSPRRYIAANITQS